MADVRPTGEEARAPRTLEEALSRLELLASSRGQLVATDGSADLRLLVERGAVELELLGRPIPEGRPDEEAIVRTVLEVIFWESPGIDVSTLRSAPEPVSRRLRVERPDAPKEICRQIAEEAGKLEAARRRIPHAHVVLAQTPQTASAKGGVLLAAKLRAAIAKGDIILSSWARSEKLDLVDAARAAADLVTANEAKVARKQDLAQTKTRIDAAAAGGGLVPGLRLEVAARLYVPRDPIRAAQTFCRAGWERLRTGRFPEATEDFEQAVTLSSAGTDPAKGGASATATRAPDAAGALLEAREGLVASLEAELEGQKKSASGTDARPSPVAKRASLELGRAYLALGYPNRARVAMERGLDELATPAAVLELISALLGAGQMARAFQQAELVLPSLDARSRRALATRFVNAGAKGPSFDRALALAGLGRDRTVSRVALVAGVLLLLASAAMGGEASGRHALADACDAATARIASHRGVPTMEDIVPLQAVATRYAQFPVASQASTYAARLTDCAADEELLAGRRGAFSYERSLDPRAAGKALEDLAHLARTPEVQEMARTAGHAYEKWAGPLVAAAAAFESARAQESQDSSAVQAMLDAARTILRVCPAWTRYLRVQTVSIPLEVHPDNVVVEWNGKSIPPPYRVDLPIEPGSCGRLAVSGPTGSKLVRHDETVSLSEVPPGLGVTLEGIPERPSVTTDPTTTAQTGGTPSTGGTKEGGTPQGGDSSGTSEPEHKVVVSVESTPTTSPTTTGNNESSLAPGKLHFVVYEVPGTDLEAAMGRSPIVVQESPGFFDALKPLIDDHLRLEIHVLTDVTDKKAYLRGAELRLFDVVEDRYIPPRKVMLDSEKFERVVRGRIEGGLSVEPFTGAHHFDRNDFFTKVRDELRSMIQDFRKDNR